MNYHLYFHYDFDGMASGAVLLNFLRSRGDNIVSFNPMNYYPALKKRWPNYKFRTPFIIVDFFYHPKADWWFDHHTTSFPYPEWKARFSADSKHNFDPRYRSVCSMVVAHLKKNFSYKAPKYISYLAKWLDVIDSAHFKSLSQIIQKKSPALKLDLFLENIPETCKDSKEAYKFVIKKLATESVTRLVSRPQVKNKINKLLSETKRSFDALKASSVATGKTVFSDATVTGLHASHFYTYHLYPKAKYSILLSYHTNLYHLSVSKNPWNKNNKVKIGDAMLKYGGGGRKDVGGLERKNKKEILIIANEITEFLNKNG